MNAPTAHLRPPHPTLARIALALLATVAVAVAVATATAVAVAAPAPDPAPAPIPQTAPGSAEETFKRALFDEEGRRDYPAALRGYEEVVRALDDQRRLAATAVFRLGECYRKLGRTNDAVTQYQRLLRDFAGEDTLATLCRQNLAGLGVAHPPATAATTSTGVMSDPRFTSGLRPTLPPGRGFDWFLGGDPGSLVTTAETDEIRRLQSLVDRSPDLLNAVQQEKTPLATAAEKGQLAVVRFLLDHGADPKSVASQMGTALHYAALAGHKAIVELLLERGTPVNAAPATRTTALHLAALHGFRGITEVLLKHGADPNALGCVNEPDPYTPLGLAAVGGHLAVAELLLAHGADPNRRAPDRFPALSFAPTADLVRLLLEHHADPNLDSGFRLMKAVQADDAETATLLLQADAKPDLIPTRGEFEHVFETDVRGQSQAAGAVGRTPLYVAVAANRWPMAGLLLKHGADINALCTPDAVGVVHLAASVSGTNMLAWVLDHGGNPDLAGGQNHTPLEATGAGLGRVTTRRRAPEAPDAWDRALLLLGRGADPVRRYNCGWTFLHAAVGSGRPDALAGLVARGTNIDVNVADPRGLTPLMLAAGDRHEAAVDWLLKCGATVDATDAEGASALLHAAARRHVPIVRRLLAAGANPNLASQLEWSPLSFIRFGRWLGGQESDGRLNLRSLNAAPPQETRKIDQELLLLLGGPKEARPETSTRAPGPVMSPALMERYGLTPGTNLSSKADTGPAGGRAPMSPELMKRYGLSPTLPSEPPAPSPAEAPPVPSESAPQEP